MSQKRSQTFVVADHFTPEISRWRSGASEWVSACRTLATGTCVRAVAAAALAWTAGAALSSPMYPMPTSRFDCQVVSVETVQRLGRGGGDAELAYFTCRVTGGLLDGFVASGTSLWDARQGAARLLYSLVVAYRGSSSVVSQFDAGERTLRSDADAASDWEGSARGTYMRATGTAAALAGRAFTTVSRSRDAGAFTIEAAVSN